MKMTLCLFLVLTLSSCQTLFSAIYQEPTIEFKSLSLKSIDISGFDLQADFEIFNPNTKTLPLGQIDYEFFIGNKPLFSGKKIESTLLAAKEKSILSIPFRITFENSTEAFKDIFIKKIRSYKLSGKADISPFSIPFSHYGELPKGI
ncbi:MAG: LEA type 2 family protein [Bdellovibrionaceae bacterium]|nr:LEA type 2 family protein [Pseudobdellovibrionaceae bacterium]NUM57986.1 LEA type 2 family protein [Pseudobdellovibrionaceae bacterium]